MQRRKFLWTPAVVGLAPEACDVEGLAPWHMWGTQVRTRVPIVTGGFAAPAVSEQLARINYKRPETWAFLFSAEIVNTDQNPTTAPFNFTVNFNIATGLGRAVFLSEDRTPIVSSVASHEAFAQFRFDFAPGDAVIGRKKWTTVGRTPVLDDTAATPERDRCEFIVGQDIQAFAVANGTGTGAPPNFVDLQLGAFFAPLSHVRPDWFADDAEPFAGGQLGGT